MDLFCFVCCMFVNCVVKQLAICLGMFVILLLSVVAGAPLYFGCFDFRGELGFLNCDDICMCVVNKQFELYEFVIESVYVDLQYDEISLTLLLGLCACVVFVVLS